jgi:hypothetical protein
MDKEIIFDKQLWDALEDKAKAIPMKPSGHPLFAELTEEELELHEAKNKDYRSNADPLANFKRVAAWMALYPNMNWATPEGVAAVYAMKQQDAALSLMERGVEGGVENVDTRARDVHIYWKILRILHRERKDV